MRSRDAAIAGAPAVAGASGDGEDGPVVYTPAGRVDALRQRPGPDEASVSLPELTAAVHKVV